MREVEVNVAYRWFLGLKLRDKVPDASTLSQNRRRRFTATSTSATTSTNKHWTSTSAPTASIKQFQRRATPDIYPPLILTSISFGPAKT